MLTQVASLVAPLPQHDTLYLLQPDVRVFEYSVFAGRGFHLIDWTEAEVARRTHRTDVSFRVIDPEQRQQPRSAGPVYTLDMRTDSIVSALSDLR